MHKQGSTFFGDTTDKGLKSQVALWCIENHDFDNGKEPDNPLDDLSIIEAYFSPEHNGDRESVTFGDDDVRITI